MRGAQNFETPAAFARRLGVNKSTISRAIARGRLFLVDGLLDIEASLTRWHETKPGLRPDVQKRHAAKRRPDQPVEAKSPVPNVAPRDVADEPFLADNLGDPLDDDAWRDEEGEPPAEQSLANYARELLAAQNAIARLALQMRQHQRYPAEDVFSEARALGATLRASLERLVDVTAPRLALLSAAADRQGLLQREIQQIGRALRREMIRALRRLRRRPA